MTQVVCTVIAAIVSPALLRLLEYVFRERQERRKQTAEQRRLKALLLKCVITNKELSRQTRLDAYDEYKREGGNSWVDVYVLSNLKIPAEQSMEERRIVKP
jgi:hypothetical protein